MSNRRLLSKVLMKMVADVNDGNCGLDDDELREIESRIGSIDCGLSNDELNKVVHQFMNLPEEKRSEILESVVDRKLYIEQICQHYGVSRMTINRWQRQGKLPPFRHESGGKDYLFESECREIN